MGYKLTCNHIGCGDICMKIMVGEYEVSVAFESGFENREPRTPSNIIIFDRNDDNANNHFLGPDNEYYPVNSFQDIFNVVKRVEKEVCCIVCGKVVDHDLVREEFLEIFHQVDFYGAESLTEQESKRCSA